MPSLSPITTTLGRAAILGAVAGPSTLVVDDAQLSDVDQSVGIGTTALTDVVATLTATGSVRVAGAGHAMHVILKDDSTAVYDVRTIALRLDDGTFLMVYSQAGIIATKAAGSSLHLALDLTIDADTAATIDFGDTDYTLPAAGEGAAGLIELATTAQVDAGADITRAVTPYQLYRAMMLRLAFMAIDARATRTPAAAFAGTFYTAIHGGASFVVAGETGEIQSSPYGLTWTHRTADASFAGTFYGGCYGGGLFLLVGSDGTVQTSTLGDTWTDRPLASGWTGSFRAVAHGGGYYVAVGDGARIERSANAIGWAAQTPDASYSDAFRGVAYSDDLGLFIAVGDVGEIQTSVDGATWERVTSGTTDDLYAVSVTPSGIFVFGGNDVLTSIDGVAWSVVATSSEDLRVCAYGDGILAVGDTSNTLGVMAAADGTLRFRSATSLLIKAVCYGESSFLFAGNAGLIQQSTVF